MSVAACNRNTRMPMEGCHAAECRPCPYYDEDGTPTAYLLARRTGNLWDQAKADRLSKVPLTPIDPELQAELGHHGPKARDRE
jgi:hypothetical protein